jgi:hypothetical protein
MYRSNRDSEGKTVGTGAALERGAGAVRALRAAEGDAEVDAWGDLTDLHEVVTALTMRRLADEERAAGHEPW